MPINIPEFHLRTPGRAVTDGLQRFFDAQAQKGILPRPVLGVDPHDPKQLAALRALQAEGAGRIVDLLIAGGLAGTGIGYLRHRKKISDARAELDDAAGASSRAVELKSAGVLSALGGAIGKVLTYPITLTKQLWQDTGKVDLNTAGPFDVPLGPLPKGWTVPTLVLGVPAAAIAGEHLMDRVTDKERQRIIAERKKKLEQQFDELLAQTLDKGAEHKSACAEFLDALAPRAAAIVKESFFDTGTLARGAVMSWWILSGILAYKAGSSFSKKRDPAYQGHKALKEFDAAERLRAPVAVRISHSPAQKRLSAPAGMPVTIDFPEYSDDFWDGKSASTYEDNMRRVQQLVDSQPKSVTEAAMRGALEGATTVPRFIGRAVAAPVVATVDFGRGAGTLISTTRDIGRDMREGASREDAVLGALAPELRATANELKQLNPEAVKQVVSTVNTIGSKIQEFKDMAGKATDTLKGWFNKGQGLIQAALPAAINMFSSARSGADAAKQDLGTQQFAGALNTSASRATQQRPGSVVPAATQIAQHATTAYKPTKDNVPFGMNPSPVPGT